MSTLIRQTKSLLKEYQTEVNQQLARFFDQKLISDGRASSSVKKLIQEIKHYTLAAGKRLRPVLIINSYFGFGGQNKPEIIKTSIFAELYHAYLLAHDDIMDESDTRHHTQTLHRKYSQKYHDQFNQPAKGPRFGDNIGILCGELLCAYANEALTASSLPADRVLEVGQYYAQILASTGYGQYHDLLSGQKNEVPKAEIDYILTNKTARYTIEAPLTAGAIFAGTSRDQIAQISKFALPLGIAFQIKDDILGTFADEAILGKPADSDIKEGKQTYLTYFAGKRSAPHDRDKLHQIIGNPDATPTDIDHVRTIFKETNALADTQKLAQEKVQESLTSLENLELNSETKKFLQGLAEYIISRKY